MSNITCRMRYPKKLGRPHGAPHYSFSVCRESSPDRCKQKSKRGHHTSNDTASSFFGVSRTYGSGETHSHVDEQIYIPYAPFASAMEDSEPLPKATTFTTSYRDTVQTVTHYPQTDPCLNMSQKTSSQDKTQYLPEEELSSLFTAPTLEFAELFPTPPVDDTLPSDDSASIYLSLFKLYLEAHMALTEIRSGNRIVSVDELKDDHGIMRAINGINELGTTSINTHNPTISPNLLLAFLTVLKCCELAEQILTALLPSNQPPMRSSSDDSLTIDYAWTAGSPVSTDNWDLSAEHIAALVRLDIHLSKFNSFVSSFTQVMQEQGRSIGVSAAQCQSRLLCLHTQIKSVVDSFIPIWK